MANNYLMAASDEDKIFVYHHLPRDRIRLLQLWHVNDQLFGTIDDYQRHQAPSYRALSYTWSYSWGPNDGKFALPLGPRGEVLHVSKNLADFLLMRARNQSKEYLWIDQICLDQRNEVERNEQVQAMGDVYKHAQEVLIWLGLPGSDTIKSLARLLALARDESDFVDLVRENRQATTDVLSNAYFTRLWIVQEMELAAKKSIMLDHKKLLELPEVIRLRIIEKQDGIQDPRLRGEDPRSVVDAFSKNGCEKAHDKVYGLQCLFYEDAMLKVDYGKSVKEVFIAFAMMIAERYNSGYGVPYSYGEIPESAVALSELCENMGLIAHAGSSSGYRFFRACLGHYQDFDAFSIELTKDPSTQRALLEHYVVERQQYPKGPTMNRIVLGD